MPLCAPSCFLKRYQSVVQGSGVIWICGGAANRGDARPDEGRGCSNLAERLAEQLPHRQTGVEGVDTANCPLRMWPLLILAIRASSSTRIVHSLFEVCFLRFRSNCGSSSRVGFAIPEALASDGRQLELPVNDN